MKKLSIIAFFFWQTFSFTQVIGLGYQTTFQSNQFVASFNNTFNKNNFKDNLQVQWGADFTTRNTNSFSGLYLKPLQVNYYFETIDRNNKPLVAISAEAAYLINNGIGNNGAVISTNFYFDAVFIYLKTGYQYHIQDKISQFYIRVGFTISQNYYLKMM